MSIPDLNQDYSPSTTSKRIPKLQPRNKSQMGKNGQDMIHKNYQNFSRQVDGYENMAIFDEEKLLLEQDGHALEEQRYLNRLKNSQIVQNGRFSNHYKKILLPEIERKKQLDL